MRLLRIEIFTCLVVAVSTFPQLKETKGNQETITLIRQSAEPHVTKSDKEIKTISKVRTESLSEQTNKSPQMEIMEIKVDDEDQQKFMAINDMISRQTEEGANATAKQVTRGGRNLDKKHAQGLSQAEISEMIHMISYPQTNSEMKFEKPAEDSERSARGFNHGYLVFAVADIDEKSSSTGRITKLHIIPAESEINSDMVMGRNVDDEAEGRVISMHKLKKYVRRLMRKIRKGTWKVAKATFFRSATPETKTPVDDSNFTGLYLKDESALKPIAL